MEDKEKTVFISYRRTASRYIARAIFQHLRYEGYDVFMDVESINSGDFERIILNQIAARAHFIIVFSKGTVERLNNPNDWLQREIVRAIDLQRNIVPILVSDFRFEDVEPFLMGKLAYLKKLNALTIPDEYFEEAMNRLCTRFLKQPIYGDVTETPLVEQKEVERKIRRAVEYSDLGSSTDSQNDLSEADRNLMISIVQELGQPTSSVMGYFDLLQGESVGLLGERQKQNVMQSKQAVNKITELAGSLFISIEDKNFEGISIHLQQLGLLINKINENSEELLKERYGILGALQRKFIDRIIASLTRMKSLLDDFEKIL